MQVGLVLEVQVLEQIEPKGFQVQEEAKGVVEEEVKEGHVDPEPGRQLEDVQVDWETRRKKY